MGFTLFILCNAVQIIMPSAFIPDLAIIPIYQVFILGCLCTSYPMVVDQLSRPRLVERPISACVVGLLLAVALADLSHFRLRWAWESSLEYLKLAIYYFLLVANINSPARLRRFLVWITLLVAVLCVLTLLQYHGAIDIESLRSLERGDDFTGTGSAGSFYQLQANGVFSDPNDYCLILLLSMVLCLYRLNDPRGSIFRIGWVVPLGLFGYAFVLTRSRGGFLGLLVALVTFLYARFGLKKAIPLLGAALPMMFALFAGRQTSLSTSGGTGQKRIQIWSVGIGEFRRRPFFGAGFRQFSEVVGIDAHNSYLAVFVDLGFFGGMLFVGMFFYALWALNFLGSRRVLIADPDMHRFRPYLMAAVAGYGTGMMTLSRSYILPTFLVTGLSATYLRGATYGNPIPELRLSERMVGRITLFAAGFMAALYVYVRLTARFGGG